MPDNTPTCREPQGCHRVVPCDPSCDAPAYEGISPTTPGPPPAWAALAHAIAAIPPAPGPYPDAALRGRVAAVLLARIKQATISGPQPFGTDPLTRFFAANEHDLADVALAELVPELAELADYRNRITWETTCGACARLLDASYAETARAETAEARIACVRKLHQRSDKRRPLDLSLTPIIHCTHCNNDWPCPTIQALDGQDTP